MALAERDYMRGPRASEGWHDAPALNRKAVRLAIVCAATVVVSIAAAVAWPHAARWRAVRAVEGASTSVTLAVKQGAPEAALSAAAARGVRVVVATGDRGANRALAADGVTAYTLPKRDLPALPRVVVDGDDAELLALARRGQRATPAQ